MGAEGRASRGSEGLLPWEKYEQLDGPRLQLAKICETRIHIYSLSVAISEGCTDQEKLHRRGTCRLNNPLGLNVAEMFSVTCRIFFPS